MEYRDFINTNMNDVITALNGSITPAPVNSELYRNFLNRKADDIITALNGTITPPPIGDELYRDFIERKFDDVISGIGSYIPPVSFPSVSGAVCSFDSQYAGLPLKAHTVDIDYTGSAISGVNVGCDNKYAGFINFNQLVRNGNFADGTTGWTINNGIGSVSSNKLTVSVTSGTKNVNNNISSAYKPQGVSGHKYFYRFYVKVNDTLNKSLAYSLNDTNYPSKTLVANTDTLIEGIYNTTNNNKFSIYIYPWGAQSVTFDGTESYELHDVNLIDLTAMFGAGNEPSTVDEVRALFPNDYYDYNVGTLTTVSAVNGVSNSFFPITFDTPIYGGSYDCLTGIVTSNKDSGGGDITPTYQQTATANCETNLVVNNIWADTGDTTLQYIKIGGNT